MCGRFSTPDQELVIKEFKISQFSEHFERVYNAAPSMALPVVRSKNGMRELIGMRWGLIPSWAKDEKIGYKMINARGESVAQKPSFKRPFLKQRCIVPVSGFYEWKIVDAGKQPYYIFPKEGALFALCGLYDSWKSPEGEVVESFSIITTEANEFMKEIHDRMPAILSMGDYDIWLDERNQDSENLQELLKPFDSGKFDAYPVSKFVNSPRNNSRKCLERLDSSEGV